jgi:hypothetical protein
MDKSFVWGDSEILAIKVELRPFLINLKMEIANG